MPDPYLEPIPELDPQGLGPKVAEEVDPAALQGSKSSAKKWAILVAFAAVVFLSVASISHKGDQPAAPPAAAPGAAPTAGAPVAPPGPVVPPAPTQ